MSTGLAALTLVHVLISLIGIVSGLAVTYTARTEAPPGQFRRTHSLVDTHFIPARLSADHPAHQAPPSHSQPGHHLSFAWRLQQDSTPGRR